MIRVILHEGRLHWGSLLFLLFAIFLIFTLLLFFVRISPLEIIFVLEGTFPRLIGLLVYFLGYQFVKALVKLVHDIFMPLIFLLLQFALFLHGTSCRKTSYWGDFGHGILIRSLLSWHIVRRFARHDVLLYFLLQVQRKCLIFLRQYFALQIRFSILLLI